MNECKQNQHNKRGNKLGVAWCIKCGRLFTKPCGRQLTKEDKLKFNCL